MKTKPKSKPKHKIKTGLKKRDKAKDGMFLELNGEINLIDITNGKKTKTPFDGELVLKLLVYFIEKAVDEYKV